MIPYNRKEKNYYTLIKQKMVIFTKTKEGFRMLKSS